MRRHLLVVTAAVIFAAGCGGRNAPQQRAIISEPSWADRFNAAQRIQNPDEWDEAFNSLALDAATDGRYGDVQAAVGEIRSAEKRDQVARGAAITLAKKGYAAGARDVAKMIADKDARKETIKAIEEFR
jgi:hypothetical protein